MFVAYKIEIHLALLQRHFFDAELFGKTTQPDNPYQLHRLVRNTPEAVAKPVAELQDIGLALHVVQFLIQRNPLRLLRNIICGEKQFEIRLDHALRYELFGLFGIGTIVELAELIDFQFLDRLFQYLLVSLIPQIRYESALLCPQQVARATDIKILHGDMDAAAQFRETFDRLQPTACIDRKSMMRRSKQITERFPVAPAHTPAKLMQFAQSEVLRIVDNDRIGVRHIHTRFDNRSSQQYIVIVIHEIENHLFQFIRRHLSVSYYHTGIRHQPMYQVLQLIQLLDTVIDKEYLTAPAQFEIDGLADNVIFARMYLGSDRITVCRRRSQYGKVACPHQ